MSLMEMEDASFISDKLSDHDKFVVGGMLDESIAADGSDDAFSPRFYHSDLVDHIKRSNRIIFIPIERDKLHISVSYIKFSIGETVKKRIFYVVDSLSKMSDSLAFFRIHLPLSITTLDENISEELWTETFNSNQVFIVFVSTFMRMIDSSFVGVRGADLCIFNECFNLIDDRLFREPVASKVIVLTSTFNFDGGDVAKFYEFLKKMEITFDSSLITSRTCNVLKKYLANYLVKSVKFTPSVVDLTRSNNILLLRKIISDLNLVLNNLDGEFNTVRSRICTMLEYIENGIETYGLYPAYVITSIYQIRLEKLRLHAERSYYIILSSFVSDFNVIRSLLEQELSKSGFLHDAKSIISCSDEKIVKLISLLYRMDFQDNCVIFVNDDTVAQMIAYILEKLSADKLMSNISVDCVVDFSSEFNSERERILRKKFKRNILKKFYKGIINVLVIPWNSDVQSNFLTADWIFYFDMPSSYKHYLISRKYGNFVDNHYFFFMKKNNLHESCERDLKLLEGFLELDASLKEVLEQKDINNMDSVFRNFRKTPESTAELIKKFPPFFTKSGKEVNLSNSITIVNEYCSNLPGDAFTRSAPRWTVLKLSDGVSGKLELPIQSSIKTPIESCPVKNIRYIRSIVAFETVKILHDLGKIDSDLVPTVKSIDHELRDVNLFPYWKDEYDGISRGSATSYNVVSMNFPEWFNDSFLKADVPCYLHVIRLKPVYPVPTSSRKLFLYNLMNSSHEYGILTRKKLPQVCEFPIYTDLGQVQVRIITNLATIIPTAEQVTQVFSFHRFVFQDVLNVIKGFLKCDNTNAINSYCVVPVASHDDVAFDIAWDVVYNLSKKEEILQPTEQQLIHTDYFGLTYCGRVATPWYQAPPHRYYIITNVLSDCTPNSCFSSSDYKSYVEYYYDKYGLEVKQPLQPLLEATSVNTSLNCLRPRAQKPGIQRRRGEKIKDFEETLVPEFCVLQPLPAVYWYKSMTLVAVLHRIHFILNAETIRRLFASTMTIDLSTQANNADPDVLIGDPSCISEIEELGKPVVPIASILKDVKLAKKIRSYPWGTDRTPPEVDKNINMSCLLEVMAYYDFIKPLTKLLTSETTTQFKQIPIKERTDNVNLKFLEIDEKLSPGPKQRDIVQALTARQCNDIVNLERFKIIGNAFLKFAASFMLYKLYPDLNIHQLNNLKQKLTGKRNLFYCGSQVHLGSFLKLQDISVCSDWNLGGFSVPEVLVNVIRNSEVSPEVIFNVELSHEEQVSGVISLKTRTNINENMIVYCNEKIKPGDAFPADSASVLTENNNHALVYLGKLCVPDKAIVDVLKSLVGVYLTNCGVRSSLCFLQKVGVLRQDVEISELYSTVEDLKLDDYHFSGFETVCDKINYKFKSSKLPYVAFVHHSSFPDCSVECNQRLAFCGEAILDVLITNYIYETCGHLSFNDIEDLHISLVNDIYYAALTVRLGFHQFLMYESPYLMEKIDEFVRKQEQVNHRIGHYDYLFLIEETNSQDVASVDVPKALSDVFKAVVAAVFFDCNGDLKIVWNICQSIMKNEFEKFSIRVPRNPARLLQDTDLPIEFKSPVSYEKDESLVKVVLNVEIDHQKRSFAGIGFSKLQAKTIAAKLALKHLYKEFTL